MTVKTPLHVGLVGFGLAGEVFHAPLIHANPNLRLTHVVQRTGDSAKRQYPDIELLRAVDPVLADPAVDLVVVATPNASHFEISHRALEAGKHVVVDKPLTVHACDADVLIAQARSRGLVLSVFQNRRWDGDFLTVQEILDRGPLGRLVEYESCFDRFRPKLRGGAWREQAVPGAGLLYDLGSHLIDQAILLFGDPKGVYADLRLQRDGAIAVDSFELHLLYPAVKVVLKAGSLVCEPSPRFTLRGTDGSYTKYGLDPQEQALKQGVLPIQPDWGAEPEESWGMLSRCAGGLNRSRYPTLAGRYPAYYENIFGAINGQEELAVKPEQARKVIRLIELAEQSAVEKRGVPAG
jgi:scyllo-inositol 2-dehydrogenase (NADP+)